LALSRDSFEGSFIGHPMDCIAQIVDENKNCVAQGELRIYGYNISKGYWVCEKDDSNTQDYCFDNLLYGFDILYTSKRSF
jgi:hypothetical protein